MKRALAIAGLVILVAGCITLDEDEGPPVLSREQVARLLPARVGGQADRDGWAGDIVAAIEPAGKAPTAERACVVIAVIEQESGYQVDPKVDNLPAIVRDGLKQRLAPLGPLAGPALKALLSGKAPGSDATFASRIAKLRTERDLDRLFRDMAQAYREKIPGTFVVATAIARLIGQGRIEDLNPVTTAGSMQVKVAFAKTLDEFEDLSDAGVREELYTRSGGVLAGTARLIGYEASYDDVIYRFADYNAGVYASRNAAFQAMVGDLTGRTLALDGDLLSYDEDGEPRKTETQSLLALLAFGRSHDVSARSIRRAVGKEKSDGFEKSDVWEEVRQAWEKQQGRPAAYARLPEVTLTSPKLGKTRSTAWFARNVKRRYDKCRRVE